MDLLQYFRDSRVVSILSMPILELVVLDLAQHVDWPEQQGTAASHDHQFHKSKAILK